jgi:hypothetical protein
VAVTQLDRAVAGSDCRFACACTGDQPQAVSVRLATAYDDAAPDIAATADAARVGTWTATTTLPASLPPGLRVWLRLQMPDGSVRESGLDDFALR